VLIGNDAAFCGLRRLAQRETSRGHSFHDLAGLTGVTRPALRPSPRPAPPHPPLVLMASHGKAIGNVTFSQNSATVPPERPSAAPPMYSGSKVRRQ